jgi:hypothetical protein
LTKFGQNEREINNLKIGNEVILGSFQSPEVGFSVCNGKSREMIQVL